MDYDKYDNQENQEVRRKRRRSRRHKNSGCAGTMVYVIAVVGASLVISLGSDLYCKRRLCIRQGQRHAAVLCFREHKAR